MSSPSTLPARPPGRPGRRSGLAAATPFVLGLCALATGCAAGGASLGDRQPATPQRPTFSSAPTTTAVGTFEVEAGFTVDPHDSLDTPLTLKTGISEETELFAGFSPFQSFDVPGPDPEGLSDLVVGMRHRFLEVDDTQAAFQLATKLPTAKSELSSRELDFFGAAIVSQRIDALTVVGFYQLGLLGDPGDERVDLQHALALAADLPLEGQVSILGELTGVATEDQPDLLFTTTGLTYAVSPSLVFDGAIRLGLNSDAPDFAFLVGFTSNFGPLFALP